MSDGERNGFVPDLEAWEAWRPETIAARLQGVDGVPWCVVGGWALDLFLGEQRREHEDLEIAVPADRFHPIAAALPDLSFFTVGSGMAWPLAENEALFREDHHHQTWGRDRATGLWRVDVMREPHEGETWIARRDTRVRMPYADLIRRTAEGIPYARPETVLLFKAKATRPKDEDDFAAVLPHLPADARRWLREALALVHPGHAWLDVV
ncbi:MAG: nucleotidyltransferase domain-containing protein [Thermomicrobiales bacterium]